MNLFQFRYISLLMFACLAACGNGSTGKAGLTRTGTIIDPEIDEASGIQASSLNPGAWFLHNDDGKPRVFVVNEKGTRLGHFDIKKATNRDWEDMTSVPSDDGPLLVLADFGDNATRHKRIHLYFVREPEPDDKGRYSGNLPILHKISLKYPDGPRDCESIAYDKANDSLYLVSKRDKPARIYTIALEKALSEEKATLDFVGELSRLRAPTARDAAYFGTQQSRWVSQPTGLDIRPDGLQAAIISYRSLYLFDRDAGESWQSAFARKPRELEGPPARGEEAVAYSVDGTYLLVTSEGVPAPVYRIRQIPADN